ncbi:hypothetical protein BC829DRAFT_20374 [Chytridium lagenaria]|nr:hypothetical protein BC829DRAFT_20374 [Chytridium lagenaria]
MNGDKPLFTIESFVHKRASSTHTQPNQRQAMLEWLETQENFALLASPSAIKASSMEGARLKKTDGYRSLCEYVNRRTHNSDWTPMIAKSRFESFMKVYRRTIVEMKHPDFGLLPDDIKRGVDTIPKKLNDLCPCFDRIDVLAKKAAELELVEVRMDARSDPDPEVVHAIDQVVNEINMVANDSMSNDMIALVGSSSKGPSIKWINNGPPLRNSIVIPQTPSSSSSSTSSIAGQKRLRDDSVEITSPVSASNASTLPQVNASSPLSVATNHAGGAGSGSGSSVIARANLTNGAGLGSGGSSMSRSGVNGALNGGSPSARTNVTTGSVINILSVAGLGGSTNGGGVGGSGILGNGQRRDIIVTGIPTASQRRV